MKKVIIVAAVIVTACIHTLSAQTNQKVSSAVAESFAREFNGATDVKWTKIRNVAQARFFQGQEYCLAYFNEEGGLILSGRKISYEIAPTAVKKELQRIRDKAEAKNDLLTVAEVYELNDAQETKYFINLDSDSFSMSVMAYGNGRSEILKKETRKNVESASSLTAGRH